MNLLNKSLNRKVFNSSYRYFNIKYNDMTLRNIFICNTEGVESDIYFKFLLIKVIDILSEAPHYIKTDRESINIKNIYRNKNTIKSLEFIIKNINDCVIKVEEDVYIPPMKTQIGVEPTIYKL